MEVFGLLLFSTSPLDFFPCDILKIFFRFLFIFEFILFKHKSGPLNTKALLGIEIEQL